MATHKKRAVKKRRTAKKKAVVQVPLTAVQKIHPALPSSVGTEVTPDQLALIKRTIAPTATDDELQLHFFVCKMHNVHPLSNLIVFSKFNSNDGTSKYTPITTIDFLRARAQEYQGYAGVDLPIFEEGSPYPKSATVTVYKMIGRQRVPFSAKVLWSEFYPGDKRGFMWRNKPHHMLAKCAEAQALRKAFPHSISGLYIREEMEQGNNMEVPRQETPASEGEVLTEQLLASTEKEAKRKQPEVVEAEVVEESPAHSTSGNSPAYQGWVERITKTSSERTLKSIVSSVSSASDIDGMEKDELLKMAQGALQKVLDGKKAKKEEEQPAESKTPMTAEEYGKLLFADIVAALRKFAPELGMKDKKGNSLVSKEDFAVIEQMLVDVFGFSDSERIRKLSIEQLEKGLSKLNMQVQLAITERAERKNS